MGSTATFLRSTTSVQVTSMAPSLPTSRRKVLPEVPSTKLTRSERLNPGCASVSG